MTEMHNRGFDMKITDLIDIVSHETKPVSQSNRNPQDHISQLVEAAKEVLEQEESQ